MEYENETLKLTPLGTLDKYEADVIKNRINDALNKVSAILIDASCVEKIDMNGFRALAEMKQICERCDKHFSIVNTDEKLDGFFSLFSLIFYGSKDYFEIGLQQ